MQDSENIYHQETTPPLARKRRRRSSSHRESDAARAPGLGKPQVEAQDRQIYAHRDTSSPYGDSRRRSHRSHRSSRHHHNGDSSNGRRASRILWISLVVLAGAYLGVLAFKKFSGDKPAAGAQAASPAQATPGAPAEKAAENPLLTVESLIDGNIKANDASTLAAGFKENNQIEKAAARLEEALALNPSSLKLKMELADVYAEQKRHSKVTDLLLEVLAADPTLYRAKLALAASFLEQKNDAAALTVAKWILETDAYSSDVHEIAATAYLNMNNPGWAIPHLRRVVNLEPDNVTAQNKLALAYIGEGDYKRAERIFESMLELAKSESVTYYNLAVCYTKQMKADDAVRVLASAVNTFGKPFVGAWIRSRDFDPIRASDGFTKLEKELLPEQPAPANP